MVVVVFILKNKIMIKVRIYGGLGNQMFQYALGKSMSLNNNTKLTLDISWYYKYGKNTKRRFGLDEFNIDAKISKGVFSGLINRALYKIGLFNNGYIKEKKLFGFDQSITNYNNVYLDGFWQNKDYFKDFSDNIKKDFSLKETPTYNISIFLKKINDSESVAIHIRRGDYVDNSHANNFHGLCSLEYYNQAISHIKNRIKNPYFFIFSDDIEWVKKNLVIGEQVAWVSGNKFSDTEELFLMSACKHDIIANSTFSWWGAWLNSYNKKIIIAPKKWLNDKRFEVNGLILDEWKLI